MQQEQHMDQPLPPAPLRIDMESLYNLFDEMTEQQLKDLIEDIEQEIDIRKYEQRRVNIAKNRVSREKYLHDQQLLADQLRYEKELQEEARRYAKEKQKFIEDFEAEKERIRMGLVKQQIVSEEDQSSSNVDDFSDSETETDNEDVGDSSSEDEDIVEVVAEKPKPKPKSKPLPPVKPKAKAKSKAKKVEDEVVEEEPAKRAPIKRGNKKSK